MKRLHLSPKLYSLLITVVVATIVLILYYRSKSNEIANSNASATITSRIEQPQLVTDMAGARAAAIGTWTGETLFEDYKVWYRVQIDTNLQATVYAAKVTEDNWGKKQWKGRVRIESGKYRDSGERFYGVSFDHFPYLSVIHGGLASSMEVMTTFNGSGSVIFANEKEAFVHVEWADGSFPNFQYYHKDVPLTKRDTFPFVP